MKLNKKKSISSVVGRMNGWIIPCDAFLCPAVGFADSVRDQQERGEHADIATGGPEQLRRFDAAVLTAAPNSKLCSVTLARLRSDRLPTSEQPAAPCRYSSPSKFE